MIDLRSHCSASAGELPSDREWESVAIVVSFVFVVASCRSATNQPTLSLFFVGVSFLLSSCSRFCFVPFERTREEKAGMKWRGRSLGRSLCRLLSGSVVLLLR